MSEYADFLSRKRREWTAHGVESYELPTGALFPFQAKLTEWALRKGRAAIFADTGLGKTRMQLAWAANIPGRVLILVPLCVAAQTIEEAKALDLAVYPAGMGAQIEITNYEQLHHIDPSQYTGVVLDESSILKAFDGKTRTRLTAAFGQTPYRLCCTATPAPNDIAELTNHCEFLGVLTRAEMLATFFVHTDDANAGRAGWRLKRHGREAFYRWLASWGLFVRHPSDLGFVDDGFLLPPLTIRQVIAAGGLSVVGPYLFPGMGLDGIRGRLHARRASLDARVKVALKLVEATREPWIVWCGLNAEQEAIAEGLGEECVSIAGRDESADKTRKIRAFLSGGARVLVSKPRIAGYGLNLQHCARMLFLGLSDSYEQYYQSIRRCWRFGQHRPVEAVIVVSEAEIEIVANVRRKEAEASRLAEGLIQAMAAIEREEIGMTTRQRMTDERRTTHGAEWTLHLGDCAEVLGELPNASVDLSVFSPPFLSLYTYTASERDLGNSGTREEFLEHFGYVLRELRRVMKPGRLTCCHIAQVTSTKAMAGVIGLIDLRGAVIERFVREGWIYHGDITIDKDPQAQAIRTKAKGLLFVQLHKDASWLRPALADYLLVFRAPGENSIPVKPDVSNDDWIEWARPVWYGIRESDTLSAAEARANDDERHICPLQLPVIERCVKLWSNPGEIILDPFAGIGSTGYVALKYGRHFTGIELKPEYFAAAEKNLRRAEDAATRQGRFAWDQTAMLSSGRAPAGGPEEAGGPVPEPDP